MDLQSALSQIDEIQNQMARTRTFRGYRAGTTLLTGIAAIGAALWQARSIPDPSLHPMAFADLWVCVAVGSVVVVAAEITRRYLNAESSLERGLTVHAVEQFLPCVLVGGLVTMVLCDFAPAGMWTLPGLWAIFFGLGMLASRRLLPKGILFVSLFYLLCGLGCLALGPGGLKISAWTMGLTFGLGQTASAAALHWSLEKRHES